jgi:hypothetical protein
MLAEGDCWNVGRNFAPWHKRHADGGITRSMNATPEEMWLASDDVEELLNVVWYESSHRKTWLLTAGCLRYAHSAETAHSRVWRIEEYADNNPSPLTNGAMEEILGVDFMRPAVSIPALIRCTYGNPFRPAAFDEEWRTSTVVSVAKGIYDSRDFSPMPLLADALQDAGCENEDILNHCREDGPHVRGCWVVDLILGKE